MSKERLEEIKVELCEIQELINKSKQEDNGKINEKIINLYLDNHIDWLVQRNDQYTEIFKRIIDVKNDKEFNPYAYMILEIIEWAEDALGGRIILTDKDHLEGVKNLIDKYENCYDKEIALKYASDLMRYHARYFVKQTERVQELEKEFELCDSTMHMIDMAINNPSTSDDDKWEKVNKIIKKHYADDCIHCNSKGFNGLDYCPQCKKGRALEVEE